MSENSINKLPNLVDEISRVVLGKRDIIELTITAILADGHVLFEDVPGVGKTLLVKTIASALQIDFNRIQFTPDLLPSDIVGVSIFDQRTHEFKFHEGPIFTTLLLIDEINRTTPKTQAALLEAMAEKNVTIDNKTYDLSSNFTVLATQNPLEYEGTYPLPEAQLDRFLFKLKIGYPEFSDELTLMLGEKRETIDVKPILTVAELSELKKEVELVFLHEKVAEYALNLVHASRNHDAVLLGISPRGSEAFVKAAKAYALLKGRQHVVPSDFQKVLPACFSHRIQLKNKDVHHNNQMAEILEQIIQRVPIPIRRD
ncbi:MoxR family ATPase [Vagococcus fluvialis]|uniref:AAA family ATPase n=1 Tax=Vagococcus fluvialis TaxID=2738 RepID=UPI001A8ECDE6|nr:MoxR family ATPase [Vagococcus fluvialis]MBO0429175.1 MoxR family ATPase [Vagococcus fluvialis]